MINTVHPTHDTRAARSTAFWAGARLSRQGCVIAGSQGLTPAEYAVALLMAQGLSCTQIASQLDMRIGTVHRHRQDIRDKWGPSVSSGVEFAAKLLSLGVIDAPTWVTMVGQQRITPWV